MADWRDFILQEFTPELARLTLVADPDGLLTEESVQAGIRQRGFDLIQFDDPVAFRYAYESKYRVLWDSGQSTELVVALRAESDSLRHLPYDLLKTGRLLDFRLPQIFPNLSYPVVQLLKPSEFDRLYQGQLLHGGNVLGDRGTMDFILDYVFDCLPKQSWAPKDLLRALLRHHYAQRVLPTPLAERFVEILGTNVAFRCWPLRRIATKRSGFLELLQEQWQKFIGEHASSVRDDAADCLHLPFGHEDVRAYLENFFAEGLLMPVECESEKLPQSDWAQCGVITDPARTVSRRFRKITTLLAEELPSVEAASEQWQAYAMRLAEFNSLCVDAEARGIGVGEMMPGDLRPEIDRRFTQWLQARYSTLPAQAPNPPVMVHHIARHLARLREKHECPVALIVVDGLALDQWLAVRTFMAGEHPGWRFSERSAFAWCPTITPISRQAIFAGKIPFFFSSSVDSTSKDSTHWTAFWSDHGLAEHKTGYVKITRKQESSDLADLLPSLNQVAALGVVLTAVDEVMHGIVLGRPQLHSSIQIWTKGGVLAQLIELLLDAGFHIALTSDHGNIAAKGAGSPNEGMLAEVRGERVRIYPDESLRAKSATGFSKSLAWTPEGLPKDYHPLFALPTEAFITKGEERICHGGISVEEVLVPFIEISEKEGLL